MLLVIKSCKPSYFLYIKILQYCIIMYQLHYNHTHAVATVLGTSIVFYGQGKGKNKTTSTVPVQ